MAKKQGWGFLTRALLALTVAVLLGRCVVIFLNHNYNAAAEANGLYGLLEVADGNLLYPPRTQRPYGIYLYTPLQAFGLGTALRALHIDELRARVLFVRFASFFALGLAIWMAARSWVGRGKVTAGAFVIAVILAMAKFSDYASSSRNDMLSLFFEIGALLLFARWIRERNQRVYYLFIAFSCFSLWTRQMGICVFGAALVWLALRREFAVLFRTGLWYGVVNALFFLALFYQTNGAMVDHIILSNIRGFRPFNDHFVDMSLLTFIFGYFLYIVLIAAGLRLFYRRGMDEETGFLALALGLSFSVSGFLFLRAGGDTNYFFLSLFIGIYFAATALDEISSRGSVTFRRRVTVALALQLLFVQAVYLYKIQSSAKTGFLPYEAVAARIKSEIPAMGLVVGTLSQGMGIHLRGWAAHGPDVTNAGLIARNAHRSQRWILFDIHERLESGEVTSVLIADPNCANRGWMQRDWYPYFGEYEQIAPWLCVYRNQRHVMPDSRVSVLLQK